MKIYNKSTFVEGVSLSILGLVLFVVIFMTGFDIKKIILSTLLFLVGIASLLRSLSKTMTTEDKMDEADEHNTLISLKAKEKALQITQIISWILMLVLFIVGGVNNNTLLISFGTGIMIPFVISLFGEFFCFIHYKTKK